MLEVNLITAFGAGLVTFFAPCTFIALPTFISYLVFSATGEDKSSTGVKYRIKVLLSALSYVAGFLLIFTLLGMTATSIGAALHKNSELLTKIGAITIIGFGLFILFGERVSKLQFLFKEKKIEFKPNQLSKGYFYPFIIGVTSAFAWTPCIGPILGSILFLAGSSTQTVAEGGFLLFIYGLGITLPFLFISIFIGSAEKWIRKFARHTQLLHRISAILLIVFGIFLLTGISGYLYGIFFRLFPSF